MNTILDLMSDMIFSPTAEQYRIAARTLGHTLHCKCSTCELVIEIALACAAADCAALRQKSSRRR